jgi:hypothetical protein
MRKIIEYIFIPACDDCDSSLTDRPVSHVDEVAVVCCSDTANDDITMVVSK